VCILSVILTYIYHDARFRECKVPYSALIYTVAKRQQRRKKLLVIK